MPELCFLPETHKTFVKYQIVSKTQVYNFTDVLQLGPALLGENQTLISNNIRIFLDIFVSRQPPASPNRG